MFAVPGWSVSAETLKTQEGPKFTNSAPLSSPDQGPGKNSTRRKRKRGQDRHNPESLTVTDDNLADLWKKYIEGKDITAKVDEDETKLKSEQKQKKRRKPGIEGAKHIGRIENDAVAQQPEEDGEEVEGREHDNSVELEAETKVPTESGGAEVPLKQSLDAKLSGKAKYQHRRLLALKKKELKASLQSTGSLPLSQANTLNQSSISEKPEDSSLNLNAPSYSLSQPPSSTSPNSDSTATALTPLQSQMRSKLIAARFRHLNETLYTTASTHALHLFTESPSSFASYHAGFRAQVSVWPQNPVDTFIEDLKTRAPLSAASLLQSQKKKWRDERKGKQKPVKSLPESLDNSVLTPLPRSKSGFCTIADLGCGDAKLAASLLPYSTTHSLRIFSYDLSTGDGPNAALITVADLCQLPLKDGEVDIAVLCLALMGTNWVDGVDEVARVVRAGGEVWIAEIRSRFQRGNRTNKNQGGEERQGKGKRSKHPSAIAKGTSNSDNDDDETIALDVDAESLSKENNTNIRTQNRKDQPEATEPGALDPFLDIWRRRGFTLSGSIDQSNRMFVRMKFIKLGKIPLPPAARSGTGEHELTTRRAKSHTGTNGPRGKNKPWVSSRSGERDREKEREEESQVLKPCLYKIR